MTVTLLFSMIFLIPFVVFLLIIGIRFLFPKFFRSILLRILNVSVCVFGACMPLLLGVIWAAAHDIWHDYISTPLVSSYGSSVPGWYVESVHSCPGEWRVFTIAFLIIIAFQILLFARFLVKQANHLDTPIPNP